MLSSIDSPGVDRFELDLFVCQLCRIVHVWFAVHVNLVQLSIESKINNQELSSVACAIFRPQYGSDTDRKGFISP